MRKKTELISYLPPFLAEYEEIRETLKAQDPEFDSLWEASERVLRNGFADTADEAGVKRFEKLLGITPSQEDSIEVRRSAIRSRWLRSLPYTAGMLIKKLTVLCGNDFKVTVSPDEYKVRIITHLRLYGEILALREILDEMIPANMTSESFNSISFNADGAAFVYTGFRITGKHRKIKTEVKNYGME